MPGVATMAVNKKLLDQTMELYYVCCWLILCLQLLLDWFDTCMVELIGNDVQRFRARFKSFKWMRSKVSGDAIKNIYITLAC